MIFVTAITVIYSINFTYLTAKVLFFGDALEDVGSVFFIAHSFYSCTILCIYILWIIVYGSEANNIDILLKEKFHKIQSKCNMVILQACKDRVFKNDATGEIHIILEENGKYFLSKDKKELANLDGYSSIKDDLIEKTEMLKDQLE
tara:strand:+ start:49 stop:486 length:438 start_codon:yes stop_codon:yes gene_type:complete